MCNREQIRLKITPSALLMAAIFIFAASSACLAAVLAAVVCHEAGHFLTLRVFGADVDALQVSVFGIQMHIGNAERLSYGKEAICVLAGPLVNLTLSWMLGMLGRTHEEAFLFSGAQLVLGIYNLLPIVTLDGGRLLWIIVGWVSDPFFADWVCRWVSIIFLILLGGTAGLLWIRYRSFFLVVGIIGIICCLIRELGLVNRHGKR